MKAWHVVFVALVVAVTLTPAAAAGSQAAKQRVVIALKDLPNGSFVLSPKGAGTVERDSGKTRIAIKGPRTATRDGQTFEIFDLVWTLTGKRGSLTLREHRDWFDTGDAFIGTGTWRVVRGTGAYAGAAGSGRSAHVGHDRGNGAWFVRQEGFLTPT
jgi:hypothetical protein